jgi:CPA1 family monovalent cation:H+ antiporter
MSVIPLVLVLFAVNAGLRALADRLAIPLPTLLVLGGLALALIPGVPRLPLEPQAIFLIFVPPLLFWAALTTSLRDLRRNLRAIILLAVGLVLATMVVVAITAHALLPRLSWPMCFVLGAIVSPPDAVAVTAVTRRLQLPSRLLSVLEGESLINDATALVCYQMAATAAVTSHFSLSGAPVSLLLTGFGGLAIGLLVGVMVGWVREHMPRETVVENTVSLLTPFVAFLPAATVGVSGVLSVVAAGLYLGRRGPHVVTAETRLAAQAMWDIVSFLLEGLIFIFIGLELPLVIRGLNGSALRDLVVQALWISGAMIAFRIAWVFPAAYLPRWLQRRSGVQVDYPSTRQIFFVGWAGIRGGDSLVIALALPYVAASGMPLLGRNEVIFLTFTIILITLVVQGLTLRPMIRLLKLRGSHEQESEEQRARCVSIRAGIERLGELTDSGQVDPALAADLRRHAQNRIRHLQQPGQDTSDGESLSSYEPLRLAMIAAERNAVVRLRDDNVISDDVMRQLQRELDHEEVLLRGQDEA